MDEREQPRTWTLEQSLTGARGRHVVFDIEDGPNLESFGDRVTVVELEPILNLLERIDYEVKVDMQDRPSRAVISDIETLLQVHGRLK